MPCHADAAICAIIFAGHAISPCHFLSPERHAAISLIAAFHCRAIFADAFSFFTMASAFIFAIFRHAADFRLPFCHIATPAAIAAADYAIFAAAIFAILLRRHAIADAIMPLPTPLPLLRCFRFCHFSLFLSPMLIFFAFFISLFVVIFIDICHY